MIFWQNNKTLAQDLLPACLAHQVILCGTNNGGLHPPTGQGFITESSLRRQGFRWPATKSSTAMGFISHPHYCGMAAHIPGEKIL